MAEDDFEDDALIFNEQIATGVVNFKLSGDIDLAKRHIHDGRKVLGGLKAYTGANEGNTGFHHRNVTLDDGTVIQASSNSGIDSVRITAPRKPSKRIVPVPKFRNVVPENELEAVGNFLLLVHDGGTEENPSRTIYRFNAKSGNTTKLKTTSDAARGVASGYTTYMIMGLGGAGRIVDKDWGDVASFSVGTDDDANTRTGCAFADGLYYAQGGGSVTVMDETGKVITTFSAGLTDSLVAGLAGIPKGGVAVFGYTQSEEGGELAVFSPKGARLGYVKSADMYDSFFWAEATVTNMVGATDADAFVDHIPDQDAVLDSQGPPHMTARSLFGGGPGPTDSEPSRPDWAGFFGKKGFGPRAYIDGILAVVDERNVAIESTSRNVPIAPWIHTMSDGLSTSTTFKSVIPVQKPVSGRRAVIVGLCPDFTVLDKLKELNTEAETDFGWPYKMDLEE